LNSLLDEAAKSDGANRRDFSHAQREAVKADFDRIRRYFAEEFTREGTHGLVIFSDGLDNIWRTLPLAESVRDRVKVGRQLYLAPLVRLLGRGDGAIVVFVSREQGRFYRLHAGRLEELVDHFEEQPRRHDQGGWSQARYQRHVDALVDDHLRTVAEELDRQVRRLRNVQVVVIGPDETWAEFGELVAPETRNAIVGRATVEAHAGPRELLAAAAPLLERWRAEQEGELLARWSEEVGRDARASRGWEKTLEAASDGRVEVLLFGEGVDRPAWRCPQCGRAAAAAGKCPLDGTEMEERSEGLDLAVHQTLVHGGRVWSVQGGDALSAAEGIGALLRY
jgi:peptide chain release factor subunit 1